MVILLTLSIILLVFQYQPAQTWAAKKAADYLSKKLNTTVSIKYLYIKPFSAVVLKDFFVLDKEKDTLISMPKLVVDINGFSLVTSITRKKLDLNLIELDNGSFYLKKLKDSSTNLSFIIKAFSSPDTGKVRKKPGNPWTVKYEKIVINNLHLRYKNRQVDTLIKGVNFDDADVKNFSAEILNMDITHHLFKGDVKHLTFKEKSGFYVKNLTTDATVDSNQILATHLLLVTPKSNLKDFFRMKFKSFSEVSDHIEDRVYMEGDFKDSRISSSDISFFTSGLERVKFDLGINGRVKGYVNNLRSKDLLITGGQATYVRGDFHLRGLPDWDNTFLELNFEQIATNKKDLDFLYQNFSGSPKNKVPDIIARFGNINFSGRFSGLQNDFVAYGTFKTKLGRFDPDLNFKLGKKGIPTYSGKITAYNFDLGGLLADNTVGRTSLTANVVGGGDEMKNLTEKVSANIKYIGLKGYNYNNLTLNGTFINQKADGKLTINDKNINLGLKGSINLKPKLPVYDFAATVLDAHLHTLRLLDDTITFSAKLNSHFTGDNLNNIQGSFLLSPIRIIDPRHNYLVDSLYLTAKGLDSLRQIAVESDFLNGNLKGTYDLNTLPSYFKTIAKKYIPSLKTTIVPPKPQNLEFNIILKQPDPLLALFVPNLSIPDNGTINGKFDSKSKTAILTGYIKTIKYGKTLFHDLILDESTTDDLLGVNLSLRQIDITDSLFIKNITITNFIRKDSLNFNVKLADKDATNQLDLYGLVEFGRDTTAKLKLLPSDVILEHQKWRLTDQVRIRLLDGKTQVTGFELSNGKQKVKINGFISDNPEDKLKLEFDKFSMTTLDQLTKSEGIKLKGSLNGNVLFSSIMKSPGVDAHLDIDSLMMNKTLVGDVKILSTLDNAQSEADMKVNIFNHGLQTLNLNGVYAIGKNTDDKLDFDVKMDHTEAIIFEPFIKDLVSNLQGTVSSNLKMTGPPSKPQFNGDITLNNTGLTVNYLQTSYVVNNKLSVTNSVIDVDSMVLKGPHGGTGVVKGKVDLTDLSNPDIEVTLDAKNLMALNTTFKNNHLYYGQAYATGSFGFRGPVDNMKIDIKARTEAGTVFNLPLNTSSTASDYEYIRFVGHKDTAGNKTPAVNLFNGVTLNFDLTIDEKTIVKISTDYGKLEGSGTATNLNLNINSLGDFQMFGDFLITSGKFEFTAKNFISKNFTVNQGGTIRWTGDPANADINLKAIYEVRTALANLYTAAGLSYPQGNQLRLVQAQLILTKSLLLPKIDFDFNFPTDPSVKDDVGTYLNDENNRNEQALSVIVTRNFNPGTGGSLTNDAVQTAGEAVSEFAFNKLNALIAQSNIKYLDLNIRAINDASASLKFYNDRIVFSGSLFTNTGSNNLFGNNNSSLFNSNISNLTKDFSAQYLIRPDGSLTGRYSYRVINTTTLNTIDQLSNQYVNGVGLIYQRDFDTLGEFIRNFFRNNNKKQPVKPLPVPSTTPVITSSPEDEED